MRNPKPRMLTRHHSLGFHPSFVSCSSRCSVFCTNNSNVYGILQIHIELQKRKDIWKIMIILKWLNSGSTLISVTPANFDHFWVYPKLDNPPTPQKSSSRRVLEFFVHQPKVQVIPILKFSLQNYLWFHVPPSPAFNSPSPSGISRWFMMRCTFGSTWWMARCQKRHKNVTGGVSFFCRFRGSKGSKDGRRIFLPDFLSVLFESQKATSYMNSCWLQTWCDVARKYGVEHYILFGNYIMVTLPGFDQTTSRTSYALLQTHWIRLSEMVN